LRWLEHPLISARMETGGEAQIMIFTADTQTASELEWVVQRAGIASAVERLDEGNEVRDRLTLRVRDGGLPLLLIIDARRNSLEASALLKWLAGAETMARILLLVLVSTNSSEEFLQLLGADVVITRLPDALKMRQLFGIAAQLARLRLPQAEEERPVPRKAMPPPRRPREDRS
jgi:hypothetical protein